MMSNPNAPGLFMPTTGVSDWELINISCSVRGFDYRYAEWPADNAVAAICGRARRAERLLDAISEMWDQHNLPLTVAEVSQLIAECRSSRYPV